MTKKQHNLLVKEAESIGWPIAFKDDLYKWDSLSLSKRGIESFGWILRQHGTDIFTDYQENGRNCFAWAQAIIDIDPTVKTYWFSSGKLAPVDHREFLIRLRGFNCDKCKDTGYIKTNDRYTFIYCDCDKGYNESLYPAYEG